SLTPDASTLSKRPTVASRIITAVPGDDLQRIINDLSDAGGGVLSLNPGTYYPTASISVPSNIIIEGNGAVIDFGAGAYSILINGADAYTTGTFSVTQGSTTVTGSGTTWTATMVGRSILLGDLWYEITAVGGVTSLTIGSAYTGTSLSGENYAIATTVDGVSLAKLTLQNSTAPLVSFSYVNTFTLDSVNLLQGQYGISGTYGSFVNLLNLYCNGCGIGLSLTLVP